VALAWQAVVYKSVPDVATEYERYSSFAENEWMNTEKEVKSTFSIDVDNASYTNFRRFINQGQLPPKDAVRLEEWMNFFNYDLEAPDMNDVDPLKITSESGPCPWEPQDELVMIKLQGKRADVATLPASNLVFLVDVSGSMNQPNKLPLVQESMLKLVDQLRPEDKLSIVAYAGYAGIVLKPTSGDRKDEMRKAINGLTSGGGTAGSEGIKTAYKLAEENLVAGGNNRVIIASDGDWNIGITGNDELKKLIEEHRESGIYLSVMGFGMGNLNDSMMEMLADNGNGNYVYVDSEKEADRVFGAEFAGTMYTIAKDVKLQIEFDPTVVESYRLIGYENRVLENWMFEADSIDAGDLGMGQNVVAFYQIKRKETAQGLSVGKVDFRYKPLDSDESKLLSHSLRSSDEKVSSDYLFASCVAEFTMCLRESENRGNGTMQAAILRGRQNLGDPENKLGYEKRVEFVGMMESVGGMYEEYVLEEPEIVPEDKGINLKMYPNPTSDFTTIDVGEYLSGAWSVQVFDMAGALQSVQHFTDTQLGRVEVAGLPPATYIVKVYGQGYNFGYLRLVVI
jgi:Ca-activated chloride channel family protein